MMNELIIRRIFFLNWIQGCHWLHFFVKIGKVSYYVSLKNILSYSGHFIIYIKDILK